MFIKKVILLLFCVQIFSSVVYAIETIDARNNAYIHNEKGLNYLKEKYYYGAIKEFQIAIDLNPESQASAVFYANLGKTYEKIGYPALARPCFEKAVSLNILYFEYYVMLAENYKKLGLVDKKIIEHDLKNGSPLNDVLVGLLYIQKGQKSTGITILDEFCNKEPNLLITSGVKNYIKLISK